jgi:hypothetical protein
MQGGAHGNDKRLLSAIAMCLEKRAIAERQRKSLHFAEGIRVAGNAARGCLGAPEVLIYVWGNAAWGMGVLWQRYQIG